ncbi:MAG: Gfo/Idh/MocA family protein [Candidatus Binatus sp.]
MVKLAIAGFGRLARNYYVPALATLRHAQIVAVADPLAASRDAAVECFPAARIYSDYRELPASESIDALVVASPPSTHLAIWNLASQRRIPVLMEKPFVLGGEFERAASSAEARPLLMPNFNRRFWPSYRKMRELCLDGSIGEVERATFTLRVNLEPWSSVTRHRLDPGEGGALYDLGSSQLDLIEFVFGRAIAAVNARISEIESSGRRVLLRVLLNGGVRARCELGYSARNRESVSIVGAKASVYLENPNAALHVAARGTRKFLAEKWLRDSIAFGTRAVLRERSMLRYTIRASLAEFIDALSAGRGFSPGFDAAARNSVCLDAALKSAAKHRTVEVKSIESEHVHQAQA